MIAGLSTIVPPKLFPSYAAYKTWFTNQHAAFVLPNDAKECGPFLGPTFRPAKPPWKLNWWIIFDDGNYICCSEYFDLVKRNPDAGQLSQFSYHYGKHRGSVGKNGCPKHSSSKDTLFRIDLAPHYADHIHFNGEDHIPQSRLKGSLVVLDTSMFGFIGRILHHRQSGTSLPECFDFEVQ